MNSKFACLPIEELNKLSYDARGAAFEVYTNLGPGLLESIYTICLMDELIEMGLHVESEVHLPVVYKRKTMNKELKIDLLVEKALIIEVKAVEKLTPLHYAQTLTYLKLSGLKLGLLMNFNSTDMNQSIKRVIN